MEDELTLRQTVVLWLFTFISLSSVFIIGIILNTLVFCFVLFIAYSIINMVLIKIGKKEHAPTVRISKTLEIDSVFMCYFVSNLMFFSCMVIMKYSANLMGHVEAAILGMILIAFASLILSGIFYWKPKGESNYKILLDYIKFNGITDEVIEAEILLKKRVSAQEFMLYKRILIDGCGSSASWDGAESEFDVHREKIKQALDKCYFFMIGRLDL